MTQREIVIRLCEAYIKAGKTVDLSDVIKIANYIMVHTTDSTPYYYSSTYTNKELNDLCTYTTTCATANQAMCVSEVANESQESITL